MNQSPQLIRDTIRAEFESTRAAFHALLDTFTEEDMHRQSLNPGWTNGEILAHMIFGFMVVDALLPVERFWRRLPREWSKPFAWLLNALTGPFNWINALGARGQGKVFTHERIGKIYDRAHFSLLKKVDAIRDNEWQKGMYYPTKWDPNFDEFMTLEKVFHYPVVHFSFHLKQIAN